MAVGGLGGLLSQIINPNLDRDLARQMTPNPNPLAQQGPGGPGPGSVDQLGNPSPGAPGAASGPPMAPAAVTAPDPVNASYAANLIKAARQDAYAAGFNRDIEGIAAGFGTAEQQQAKRAALARSGGGGVGDTLGDLTRIQGMQDTTIKDNEHARFMANAAVFAQTLSTSLGRPVSIQEATEIMNSPDLMKQFSDAAAANATTTSTQKDADAATRAWAKANPKATPQEIEDYRSSLIAGGMGGGNLEERQYLQYARDEHAAGRIPDDYPTWKSTHEATSREANATAVNIANAKKVLPGVTSSVTRMSSLADSILNREDLLKGIFADKNKLRWANDIMKADPKSNVALNAQQQGGLTHDEAQVILDAQQLHNMDYRGAFSGEGGVKGIRSQVEADRVSRAADQLINFTDANSYLKNIRTLKGTYNSAIANASGEAQALDQIPVSARYRLDPSFFEGGVNAPKNLPDWARVKTVTSSKEWEDLPEGQAYRAPNSEHGNTILIKGYEQQSLDEAGS